MKKIHIITFFLAITAVLLSTCKKDETTTTCKVIQSKLVDANTTDTIVANFTYGSDGKLIKLDMGGGNYTTYTYSGGTMTKIVYTNNIMSETDVYTLNSSGYADIAINKNANSQVVSNTVYVYDENGYLTTKTTTMTADNTDVTTTTYSYDDNGNRTSTITDHYVGGNDVFNSENDFEYYTDKINKNASTIAYEGKSNTNLAKTNTYTVMGNLALTTTYAYELDANGYISKLTTVSGGSIFYTFSVYNCK
jgi:hypothetical protein